MRRGFGLFGVVVTAILLVIVGVIAYNVGWSDGVSTHLPETAQGNVAPGYYFYGGPHFFGPGFGFFGILWFLLILFGIFWLFRLAFWGMAGRRWMRGGWGYGPGGRGYGSFEERAQEWHRRQHGEAGATPPPAGSTPPPPPPDTRSV